MLENWIKPQIPEEEELDERLHAARSKLSVLQMQIKEHGLPVLVLFEGWGTAGKGSVLGKVIKNIDPRFFKVATRIRIPDGVSVEMKTGRISIMTSVCMCLTDI